MEWLRGYYKLENDWKVSPCLAVVGSILLSSVRHCRFGLGTEFGDSWNKRNGYTIVPSLRLASPAMVRLLLLQIYL